jgi:YVTN family beta-propeller protein
VNPVTNQIYITDEGAAAVSVLDGATNTITTTVATGVNPDAVAVNPTTNQIYVANECGSDSSCSVGPGSLTVIDGASDATTTIAAGGFPLAVVVNPVSNQVYVPNSSGNNVTIVNGATNITATVTTGSSGQNNGTSIAANPATNKIYVPNSFSSTVTVINGTSNATTTITTGIGMNPDAVTVNPVTDKIYVTNLGDGTVSVIDGSTDTVSDVVTVGSSSQVNRTSIVANPVSDKIYNSNSFSNTVSVINGLTDAVTTITTGIGMTPNAVAVNPVTNEIYVTNLADDTVSVIDGSTDTVSTVVPVGSSSQVNGTSIAVNPATNKIYVPNSFSNTVTVIDGASKTTTTITTGIGTDPNKVSVNPVTNKIYVTNLGDSTVSVIDGSTDTVVDVVMVGSSSQANRTSIAANPITNKIYVPDSFSNTVTVIDGLTDTVTKIIPGTDPDALSVNLATDRIYVTNLGDGTVTAIAEEQVQPVPLTTTIAPLAGNISTTGTPTFTFTAATSFTPAAPAVENVYFQLDTWEGPWIAATSAGGGSFTGTAAPALLQGTHVVYAYATDGQDANSTGVAQEVTGQITAEVFTVILPGTTTTLASSENPAVAGDTVTFTATVSNLVAGTPTGTVTFGDGGTTLGTSPLVSGSATFATAALTAGAHSIVAIYSGDANFSGSASAVLVETVLTPNPVPTVTSLSPASAAAGGAAFTLTVNGTNFINGSVVQWNGAALTTTFVSATQLTAAVPVGDLANGGSIPVTVFTAAPGGGTSNAVNFAVNDPVPTLISLSQTSATAGGPAFTLTLTGTNFVSGTIVEWNGVALVTTFVDATHVTAAVPASDIAGGGTAMVTVFNPTPGGGTSTSITFTINDPVPTAASLAPSSSVFGGAAFTLTVNGTNFVTGSVVQWNGVALTTTLVSGTQLTAAVPASDIATAGTASVTVFNPTPAGGTSAALTFTITSSNPVPTLGSSSPTSAIAGGPAFTLTITGTNFVNGTVVEWNGVALVTTIVSGTQLTAVVPAGDIATAGTASVTIFTPAPGGGTSSALSFTINNPLPTSTLISPTSAAAGGPAFTLTITGTNFVGGSVVQWNGVALTTAFVSATQLTAAVPASDIATAGTASVTVFNSTPGGGNSGGLTFTITGPNPVPTLGSLSPTSATAGGASFTLMLTGSNFLAGTVVEWNGVALTTTFVSATQLSAVVPAGDIATAGTVSVTIFNPAPGGGTSGPVVFTINNTVPVLGSISPTSAVAGTGGFTLTLNGSNFVAGTIVDWNGMPLVTTFVSATQVTAAVPASDDASGGTISVTVLNPAPGGGTSAALTLIIADFNVSSPTPLQTTAAGQSAMFSIVTAPVGGPFPNPVTFQATGLPEGAAATFSPLSVTPGTGTAMTIATTVRTVTAFTPPLLPRTPGAPTRLPAWPALLSLAMLLAAATLNTLKPNLARRLVPVAVLVLVIAGAGYLAGCGGSGFPRLPVTNGTPAGTYTITVTGTSGTDAHSTTVMLVVQ